MENLTQCKESFVKAFEALPVKRQKAILKWFDIGSINRLMSDIKEEAESNIEYADRHGYGYGEMGYYLNEAKKDFAEDTPELESVYDDLLEAYYDYLCEAKSI